MSKRTQASSYQVVTDRILALMDNGQVPWRKPWSSLAAGGPRNLDGRPYRGVNIWTLAGQDYADPRWLTYRRAHAMGAQVRRGERSSPVVYWRWPERPKDGEGEVTGVTQPRRFALLLYYNVFNVAQVDGLGLAPIDTSRPPEFDSIAEAEYAIDNMPNPPRLTSDGGDRAYYNRRDDSVHLPRRDTFSSPQGYYDTAYHELGHATGHESRVGRHTGDSQPFGSADYGREELVAEFCSAYLCQHAGLDAAVLPNQAAYIQGWTQAVKNDPQLLVIAAAQGQKAADYILGTYAQEEAKCTAC